MLKQAKVFLSMLLTLSLAGMATQSSLCELRCGFITQAQDCHRSMMPASETAGSPTRCAGSMHSRIGSVSLDKAARCCEGNCLHGPVVSRDAIIDPGEHLTAHGQPVLAIVPFAASHVGSNRASPGAPPHQAYPRGPAPLDPLTSRLRI